jgi:integrase
VAAVIREAAAAATDARAREGLPPLPCTTPHSLRRTYISIALRANNHDVKFVMAQVGHADSKMTLDVYAQLEHRAKRDHGRRFDELIDEEDESPNDTNAGNPSDE